MSRVIAALLVRFGHGRVVCAWDNDHVWGPIHTTSISRQQFRICRRCDLTEWLTAVALR